MFFKKKHKDYNTYQISKYHDDNSILKEGSEAEVKSFWTTEMVRLPRCRYIPSLSEYSLYEFEHQWRKYDKKYVKYEHCINNERYIKSEVEKLGFVKIDGQLYPLVDYLKRGYYEDANWDYYVSPETKALLDEILKKEQKPLVFMGSDWPYYFDIGGELVPSETSSWFLFLNKKCGILTRDMLEVYKGPDKYSEHINEDK